MKRLPFQTLFGAVLLIVFVGVYWWQSPGTAMTRDEVTAYVAAAQRNLQLPDAEKREVLALLQQWGEADDGRPVYMLNLMRYNDTVRPMPGHAAFEGTPEASNRIYEDAAMPIAIAAGAFPLFAGNVHDENLTDKEPAVDNWDRVLLMRYPNRRAFLELVSDPAYGQIAYYKLAALKVALVPAVVEMSIPDVRLAVGALLLGLFLVVGWWRAARRG